MRLARIQQTFWHQAKAWQPCTKRSGRIGGMSQRPEPGIVDPADPRAPPQELWDRMSEVERERVSRSRNRTEPARRGNPVLPW